MKENVKICITATDCGDRLENVRLEVNGQGRSLLALVSLQVASLAERAGVPVYALLAAIAAASESKSPSVIVDTGAIREALGRMKGDNRP